LHFRNKPFPVRAPIYFLFHITVIEVWFLLANANTSSFGIFPQPEISFKWCNQIQPLSWRSIVSYLTVCTDDALLSQTIRAMKDWTWTWTKLGKEERVLSSTCLPGHSLILHLAAPRTRLV